MLIDRIIEFCDVEYQEKDCRDCSYGRFCPDERCDRCLHYIHTPSAAPAPRQYDCPNMANFYTCKYSHKYTSELIYALEQLKDLQRKRHLRVMSIGCGPCTDLFALDFLNEEMIYRFQTLEYRGIDIAKNVWKHIHRQIKKQSDDIYKINFYYEDITCLIDTIIEVNWIPDLIVFQYVFSDMEKHCDRKELRMFLTKIASFINNEMDDNTYIVLNDINLSTRMGGGREHFDALLQMIPDSEYRQYHFNNSNRSNHFHYGIEYETNKSILAPSENLRDYEPFDSCASAQLIVKKVMK